MRLKFQKVCSQKVFLILSGPHFLQLDTGRGTVGTAFLTDSEGNIFYKFGLPFRHGTEIRHGYVEDINGDGLRDVVLVEFFGIDNKNNKEWIILQRKDGLFYSDVLKE